MNLISVDIKLELRLGDFKLNIELESLQSTTVIVGPNGAGKSSLLKAVLGVMTPRSGRIRVGDHVFFDSERRVNVPVEDRRIGYVPQRYALFPHMTARENVGFGVDREESTRVTELLERLEIEHLADRRAKELSGGESQRVALARALAPRPKLLLMDEPTAALDSQARRRVRRFMTELFQELAVPTLIASHQLEDAEAFASGLAVIEDGQLSQVGDLDLLRKAPASEFVREFFLGSGAEPKLIRR